MSDTEQPAAPAGATPQAPPPQAPAPTAETLTALSGRLREETTRRELAEARAAHATRLEQTIAVYTSIGLPDPELAEQALANWGRLPEKDRPEIGAWMTAQKAAPPKWLVGYLPAQQPLAPAPPAPAAPAAPPAPPTPPTGGAGGAVPLATGGGASAPVVSAQGLAQLRAEARKTGDWSKVTAAVQASQKVINAR